MEGSLVQFLRQELWGDHQVNPWAATCQCQEDHLLPINTWGNSKVSLSICRLRTGELLLLITKQWTPPSILATKVHQGWCQGPPHHPLHPCKRNLPCDLVIRIFRQHFHFAEIGQLSLHCNSTLERMKKSLSVNGWTLYALCLHYTFLWTTYLYFWLIWGKYTYCIQALLT